MNKSDAVNELATALAKAQGQIKPALKDSSNPFFKSTYADLASVWEACRKPLSDNGLSIIQTIDKKDTETLLETTLLHSSGQFISSSLKIMPKEETSQAIGSAITYARRYALSAMVGVCADEDDDGEASMGRSKAKPMAKTAPQPIPAPTTTTQEGKVPPVSAQPQKNEGVEKVAVPKITEDTAKKLKAWMEKDNGSYSKGMYEYIQHFFKKAKIMELTEPEAQYLLKDLKDGKIKKAVKDAQAES